MTSFELGRKQVGAAHPTYFVADVAANHDGDLERARHLIHAAAEAGADAAKFQNFRAETIVSDRGFRDLGDQSSHQASWKKSVFEVYRDASLPVEWTATLHETCESAGIDYLTAPYDLELIDIVAPYVCAWKIGSGDITWPAAIERMARDGKPVLLATGAATMDDVRRAMDLVNRLCDKVVVMQCNTNYTGSRDNFRFISLNVLRSYAAEFPGAVLGLSDHTPGATTVLGAVALGARVVEKHFTDDPGREGPDHAFSLDPASWRQMVERTRELEAALGSDEKRVEENEQETVVLQRRAIRAARNLPEGTAITEADLTVLRPCPVDALAPYEIDLVLGRCTSRSIQEGECIRASDLADT